MATPSADSLEYGNGRLHRQAPDPEEIYLSSALPAA